MNENNERYMRSVERICDGYEPVIERLKNGEKQVVLYKNRHTVTPMFSLVGDDKVFFHHDDPVDCHIGLQRGDKDDKTVPFTLAGLASISESWWDWVVS